MTKISKFLSFTFFVVLLLINSSSCSLSFLKAKINQVAGNYSDKSISQITDSEVVIGFKIYEGKKKDFSCPPGWSHAKGCDKKGCNLNKGTDDGTRIFLCIRKVKYSKMHDKDEVFNILKLGVNTMECGDLKRISDINLNEGAGGKDLWLCGGYSLANSLVGNDLSPISEIYIKIKKDNESKIPLNAQCLPENLNLGSDGPSFGRVFQFQLESETKEIIAEGKPFDVINVENNNGSGVTDQVIKRTFTHVKTNSYTTGIETKFGSKTDVKFSKGFGVPTASTYAKVSIQVVVEVNKSETNTKTDTNTNTEILEYKCVAPAGKFVKCSGVSQNYKVNIPFSIERTIHFYDGTKKTEKINSWYRGINSGGVEFQRCCYKFCSQNDFLCGDAVVNDTNICPTQVANNSTLVPVEEFKIFNNRFDVELVTGLKLVKDDSKEISCPTNYQYVTGKNCLETRNGKQYGCDLNDKAGGKFLYLCMRKEKLSQIDHQTKILNVAQVLVNNKDCGDVKLLDHDLNQGAGGDDIYLCSGQDRDANFAPIVDITIYKPEKDGASPAGYECDPVDLNKGAGGDKMHLCLKRNIDAPKYIVINNLKYEFNNAIQTNLNNPDKLDDLYVSGGVISKKITKTSKSEQSLKKSFASSHALGIHVVLGDMKNLKFEININQSFTWTTTKTEEWKTTTEKTISTTVECKAEEGKANRCVAFLSKYRIIMPYTGSVTYFNYLDQKIHETEIKGTYEDVGVADINYKTCCVNNCCSGDPKLDIDKSYCSGKKDILCDDLDKCFK